MVLVMHISLKPQICRHVVMRLIIFVQTIKNVFISSAKEQSVTKALQI